MKIVRKCGAFENPFKPMSDFKSSKNDIPLVWFDHYHLGKTEHVGKTEFSSQKTIKEMNFSFCLTWRALEGIQYVYKNTENEVYFYCVTS